MNKQVFVKNRKLTFVSVNSIFLAVLPHILPHILFSLFFMAIFVGFHALLVCLFPELAIAMPGLFPGSLLVQTLEIIGISIAPLPLVLNLALPLAFRS